jgi:hypothetical protein
MPLRWILAVCLILTMGFAARGADADVVSTDAIPAPDDIPVMRAIPIYAPQDQDQSTGHFQATVAPPVLVRAEDASGALADSANEYVDFGWRMPIFSMFSIGYDTGVNAFRQDATIWDDEEATSTVTTALINKVSATVQSGSNVSLTPYVQGQRSLTDGQPGFSDATKYGADLAWTPFKDVTTIKADASTQATYNFNHSLMDEDLCTISADQKLPGVPLTLHTAGSITDDSAPLLTADDKSNTIVDASLLWKIVDSTSASIGTQRQDTTIPASLQLADTDTYFTQVSLQTSKTVIVTVRAAHEQTDSTAAGQFLSNSSDVLLTFGLTWNLGDTFNLGAGLNYRTLQSATPAPAVNASPASVSISAGGKF